MKKRFNKKGFTLVELIVVIAIIGVLAAILVPTMMGFARDAEITNANTHANEISEVVGQTLMKFDTQGYGMKPTRTATSIITVKLENGEWTTSVKTPASFLSKGNVDWSTAGTAITSSDNAIDHANVPQNLLSIELAKSFPSLNNAYMWFAVAGGHVEAAYYNETGTAISELETTFDDDGNLVPTATVDWNKKIAPWNEESRGITSDGLIVGTNPALLMGRLEE